MHAHLLVATVSIAAAVLVPNLAACSANCTAVRSVQVTDQNGAGVCGVSLTFGGQALSSSEDPGADGGCSGIVHFELANGGTIQVSAAGFVAASVVVPAGCDSTPPVVLSP